jgi:hypothetical protein
MAPNSASWSRQAQWQAARLPAAGDAEDVALLDGVEPLETGEGQAIGLKLAAVLPGHRHPRAGQAAEKLMRAGEVEMGDTGVEGEDNVQRGGGHGGVSLKA